MTEEGLKWEELKEMDIRMNTLCFKWQQQDGRIAELEKENARLESQVEQLQKNKQ